ncbi:MutS-related protein, partial [Psychrobacter glacincola]|uniref:MutS-related protein n=1 Tax=Psychrobacter glacincola TaxID=56810 RepID=UPI003BB7F656
VLGSHLAELQQLSAAIAQIDVLSNWAQLAIAKHWQRPVISHEPKDNNQSKDDSQTSIDIKAGRHVVVEAVLNPINIQNTINKSNNPQPASHFVANDCALGSNDSKDEHPERLLMITGPNMGGKSTYMRQTALIVLLAHCGSFVPAASAYIGDIDRIFTRIGSADDLAGGKSTFMVEMIETANILNQATNKSLVLMDEVGRGTATTDGLAIAHACVNRLVEIGCLTLFATHYFELTKLAENNIKNNENCHASIRNVHVAASEVDGQLLLLHQIREGAASSSFGLHVAKMAGIPTQVLNDAKRYLVDNLKIDNLKAENEKVVSDNIDDKNELAKSVKDKRQQTYSDGTKQANDSSNNQTKNINDNPQQNQLFSLQDELSAVDPDSLTPKQAHDLIYHLKKFISH